MRPCALSVLTHGPTNAFGAFWFVLRAIRYTRYIFIANEDSKNMGMPSTSATRMNVWLALSLAMARSAGGACF